MPGREEINRALFGAYLLARRDPRGMGYFEISVEGFWRSFFAAALAAPMFAIIVALHRPEVTAEYSIAWQFLGQTIRYVLDWAAYPLIVAEEAAQVLQGVICLGLLRGLAGVEVFPELVVLAPTFERRA